MTTKSHLWDSSARYVNIDNYISVIPHRKRANACLSSTRRPKRAMSKVRLVISIKTKLRNRSRRPLKQQDYAICNADIVNYSVDLLNEIADMLGEQHQANARELIRSITTLLSRHGSQ